MNLLRYSAYAGLDQDAVLTILLVTAPRSSALDRKSLRKDPPRIQDPGCAPCSGTKVPFAEWCNGS